MLFNSFIPALLVGAASAAPVDEESAAYAVARRQIPTKPCSYMTGGVHVIAAGGANTANQKDYGLLGSLSRRILAEIPGSTNVSLPYNKILTPNTNPPRLQPGAVADGMRTLKRYVVEYHNSCPRTKIVLIGYSSGGVITMNDICYGGDGQGTPQLNPLIAPSTVIATVLYGEETRTPNQPYNFGSCTSYPATAARANPGLCSAGYTRNLRSYCDLGDPDCCVGSPGQNTQIHFAYPAKYDVEATNFIKQRFAESR